MATITASVEGRALVWVLGSICQLNRVPFDPALLSQHFPPPYTLETLLHALKAYGFKAEAKSIAGRDLAQLIFPCVALVRAPEVPQANDVVDAVSARSDFGAAATALAESRPEPQPQAAPVPNQSFTLFVKADAGRILYFEPGHDTPQTLTVEEFDTRFEPLIVSVAKLAEAVNDQDAGGEAPAFGFRWFIPELLKHKKIWREVLAASLVIQLLALATPLFTQVVVDKVVVHHTQSTLLVIAVALFFSMVFSSGMSWIRQYLVLHTGNRVDSVLGTQVFEHLFHLPARYFEQRSTGVLVARLHGIETIRDFITGAAVTLFLDMPFLVIFLAIMFYYSWQLTLTVLTVITLIALLSLLVTPVFRQRLNQQFLVGARNQAFVTEYVSGVETVKSLQMEQQVSRRYGDYLADYLAATFNTKNLANGYNTIANFLEQMMTLVILCLGAWLVMTRTDFTIGMLVAFQMFAGRVSQPMLRLVGLWQEFQQADIAVKRMGDIMNAPAEPYSLLPAREAGGRGEITIEKLSFRYNEQLPYLYRDLNLSLKPGVCLALMGPSGSGKSTLAKLLQGFYLPSDGRILIDGRDIRNLSANELRANFGVVPQETMLFSGTVYDNLILANPHATFEQVISACKMAEIHGAIESLPQGYQTPLGEHGVGLSGGQKQRIAIARALLKRPRVLIFDEAVSSLDHATAEHLAHTINQLKGKVSMLFITHHLPKGLQVDGVIKLGEKPGEAERQVGVVSGKPEESA
ncbi:cyclolysin secretion ATP-binding protein [Sulfuriferula multivorans]|uniref:Cyclolysin secretion ATP-binding protein n=1 Tax=Sulfuriferula multivorans TaxID=1559896 RepID=A0A401JGW6_9PROT|nr:peptidase domain-containing ABC transporter [Sulfuriferula multivorans]GBL46865.1 cyclolysin secretion ATP-binding protein [Sulfuriferula multivorans]